MATLQVDGATIYYEVWGDAPGARWVVLVNGHTRPLNDFRMLGKNLVDRGCRVVSLDNRGAGRTEITREFTLRDLADDVAKLMDELTIPAACLAGLSMGGFVAQLLALDHGRRVDRLALVSTAASQEKIAIDERPWRADLDAVAAKMMPYFTADFAARNAVLVKSMLKQIVKAIEAEDFAARSDKQKRATRGFDARARLPGLHCPTLVVHGGDDAIISVEAARELARLIGGARIEVLPGAGHLLLAEKPRELYRLIGDFFCGG